MLRKRRAQKSGEDEARPRHVRCTKKIDDTNATNTTYALYYRCGCILTALSSAISSHGHHRKAEKWKCHSGRRCAAVLAVRYCCMRAACHSTVVCTVSMKEPPKWNGVTSNAPNTTDINQVKPTLRWESWRTHIIMNRSNKIQLFRRLFALSTQRRCGGTNLKK